MITSDNKTRSAFTLLELLVACAIMAVFLVLAGQIVSGSLNHWRFAQSKMAANLQARLAFDWLARDLQSLCTANDGSEWLRIEPSDPALTTDGQGNTAASSWLMCFTQPGQPHRSPTASSGSSAPRISGPVAVSYSLGYLDPMVRGGARKSFALLRTTINPQDTFESMGVGNLNTDFWGDGVLGFTRIRPEDILADNVSGFRIVAEFLPAGTSAPVRSDPARTFAYGPDGVVKVGSTEYPGAVLTGFEITLWLLDSKFAPLVGSGLLKMSDNHSVAFTKRIPLVTP